MSTLSTTERRRAAVIGALVADAAALGLHWIYTQPAIRRTAPEAPEFTEPNPANYENVFGFFAHPAKHAGDSTMYGENIALALRAMAAKGGEFDEGAFLNEFQNYFGPGGGYVGYADGPMRDTLYNAVTLTREIESKAQAMDLPGVSEESRKMIAHYVSRYFLEYEPEALKKVAREAVEMHEGTTEADVNAVDTVVDAMQLHRRPTGPDDAQMPALTRVGVTVARYAGSGSPEETERMLAILERSVRMTNNSDLAVAYAKGLARLLVAVTTESGAGAVGDPGPDAPADRAALVDLMNRSFPELPESNRADIAKALGMLGQDTKAVTLKFGPACDCAMGVPSGLHNVATAPGFTDAVRRNIYACGDSCGRAMIVGAVAGALYGIGGERGIPQAWLETTHLAPEVQELLDAVGA